MIKIINISTIRIPGQANEYVLQINNQDIVKFLHLREQGLAVCLEQAAAAVRGQWGEKADKSSDR
jgi:hypothetical protein